jgi:hypothetical protein
MTLARIVTGIVFCGKFTWLTSSILGAIFSALIYKFAMILTGTIKPHLLRLDQFTRYGLIIAGIAGSYSLGANNIGNVMGVYTCDCRGYLVFYVVFLAECIRSASLPQSLLQPVAACVETSSKVGRTH